jgi:MYXO-CTERM domain-containing protein
MKAKSLSLALAFALAGSFSLSQAQSIVIVDDLFDSGGGWSQSSPTSIQGWWPSSSSGLTAEVGNTFFTVSANTNRQYITKAFTEASFTTAGQAAFGGTNDYKIMAGTYTVSVYVGASASVAFTDSANYRIYLTAGGNAFEDRILATSSVKTPNPGAGEWQEWTFTFVIDETTQSQAGTQAIGQTLGGLVDIRATYSPSTYIATDGFKITYTPIPEPSETAMGLGAIALLAIGLLRYRRRR